MQWNYLNCRSGKEDENLVFVVVGDGPIKKDLQDQCLKLNPNVMFYDGVDKNEVLLIMQAIHILFLANQFKGYSYGVSPMKLPEYIQSKNPSFM